MPWKVEAGIPADYWFLRTLNWIYKVTVLENIRLQYPAVVRVEFDVELEQPLAKEDARMTLQTFLDTAIEVYNLYVLYASYDPSKERLTLEIELAKDIFIYDAIKLAGNLICQCFGTLDVYWDGTCDYTWISYFEVTAITVALEKKIPIAYISEEVPSRLPLVIFAGLGMLTLAAIIAKGWKKEDWRR